MLILASKSPRRIELIKKIYHQDFKILPAVIDERAIKSENNEDLPLLIAKAKAKDVSDSNRDCYVLGADTIVICNDEIFFKPKDEQEAYQMLKQLNEKEHKVETAYAMYYNGVELTSRKCFTTLVLHELTDENIKKYLLTKSSFDKAGAYGIQDKDYIKSTIVLGEYENIVGLPIKEIQENFIKFKII